MGYISHAYYLHILMKKGCQGPLEFIYCPSRYVMFTGYVYLYGLIYWLISGLLYESTSGLAWGPHYAYYFVFYLLIDTS